MAQLKSIFYLCTGLEYPVPPEPTLSPRSETCQGRGQIMKHP